MSISPSSDIVLGVAKAADPRKYRAAVEKLARASGTTPAEAEHAVAAAIEAAAASTSRTATAKTAKAAAPSAPTQSFHSAFPQDQAARAKKDPDKDFEAFFLQTVLESMLPKDSKTLFGSGPAGDIWRSMLAEQLAKELAKSTSFGIADQIAASRRLKEANNGSPALTAADQTPTSAKGAAAGHVADLRRLLWAEGELALEAQEAKSGSAPATGS